MGASLGGVRERWRQGRVVAAVSVGGVLGALGRYQLGLVFPHPAGGFPWVTFGINVSGCLAIGVLAALIEPDWLLRPFLVTGVLGGFTTFSGYAVETQHLLTGGHLAVAFGYLFGTLVAALLAVALGGSLAGRLAGRRVT